MMINTFFSFVAVSTPSALVSVRHIVSGLNVRTAETFHNSQIIQLLDAKGLKFTAAGDPPKESPQMK